MNDAAAIAAQVVDIQNDRQHKGFIKVTLHVPAECGQQLTAAMGWPTYTTPVPVAIARLNPETERKVWPHSSERPSAVSGHEPDKTPPASGPDIQARARNRLPQRAGILCNDPLFHRFLDHKYMKDHGLPLNCDASVAATYVRQFCKIESRSELKPNTEAGLRWDLLESAFVAWRDVPEYADA